MTGRPLTSADSIDPADIWQKGYSPIPLPRGQKHPPPENTTGSAPMASWADVQAWLDEGAYGNVGVRLPEGVVGVDVDAYGDKPGWATWCALTKQSWPATCIITARDGGKSGIRLYRLPEGFDETQLFGSRAGVDIIKHSHRYAMGPGSLHPDVDAIVGVIDERTGDIGLELPHAEELPVLTAEQAAELTKPEWDWTQPAREAGTCSHVSMALMRGVTALSKGTGRFESMRDTAWELVNLEREGHRGTELMLEQLELAYLHAISKAPRDTPSDIRQEFARAVRQAREKVASKPAQQLCTEHGAIPLDEPEPESEPEPEEQCPKLPLSFWTQRESLQHVRQAARSRAIGPDGVLLTCLVRVACSLDQSIVLPPHVGGVASTNLFAALVMGSGGGKTAAKSVAAELVPLVPPMPAEVPDDEHGGHPDRGTVKTITMGSPEGIAEAFGRTEVETGSKRKVWRKGEWALLIDSDEVDSFMGAAAYGAGTTPMLRMAWSGQQLGATVKGSPTVVAAHDYRLGLLVGAQPERCTALLTGKEAHGGTPQRFIWLSAQADADLTVDTIPEWPGALDWEQWKPGGKITLGSSHEVTNSHGDKVQLYGVKMPERLVRELKEAQLKQQQGLETGLDGHRNQLRLRVALALGLLERGSKPPKITEQDWELAGTVLDTSDKVRSWIAERADRAQVTEAVDSMRVRRSAEVETEHAVNRVAHVIETALVKAGGSLTGGELRRRVSGRDRDWIPSALDVLRVGGRVVSTGGHWQLKG